MKQIDQMLEKLSDIGFKTIRGNNVIQIIGFNDKVQQLLLDQITHLIRVFIVFDDPEIEDFDYLFQGCALKVPFNKPELEYEAKEIKFFIAKILNEHGIFNGLKITPLINNYQDIIVP